MTGAALPLSQDVSQWYCDGGKRSEETGEDGKCHKGPDVKASASGQKLSLVPVKKNYKNPQNM